MSESHNTTARFKDDRVWQHTPSARSWSRLRVDAILGQVDTAARSVLDVGCGDGLVARAILQRDPARLVVGADAARPGLLRMRAHVPPVVATIAALPFADRSFDLVVASEVLEHLPTAVLRLAVAELQRVARREIVISVPHQEDLERERMRCNHCDGTFNAFGHVQSFDRAALDGLLAPWRRIGDATAGPRRRYHPALLTLRHRLGLFAWDPTAACPSCEAKTFPNRNLHPLRLLCDGLNFLANPTKRDGYWIVTRFARPTADEVVR